MVGYTYQDYLKYQKYLEQDELKKKQKKYIKWTPEELEKLANIFLKFEKMYYNNDKTEEKACQDFILMEESESYEINEESNYKQSLKKKQEESRTKHDKLFRSLLNDKEEFICFIKSFVNPKINLSKDNLIKYNRSFITSKYESRISDIVYKEKGKKVYYLVEHQSSADYSMPYRMLEYSYELLKDIIDKEKINSVYFEYPKIIPIVLYTGNKIWRIPNVINLISDGEYDSVGLKLKYTLIDTNNYSKEDLLNTQSMVGYAMQADRSSKSAEVIEAIERMLFAKPDKRKEIVNIADYVFHDRITKEELTLFKEKILNGEVKEAMITVKERLAQNDERILNEGITRGIAQGIAQGISRGIAQGIAQRNVAIAKKMLSMGMSKKDIHTATGLSIKEIENIK